MNWLLAIVVVLAALALWRSKKREWKARDCGEWPPLLLTADPLVLQTYHRKDKIPGHVTDAWASLAPGHARHVLDDAQGRAFLQKHFPWTLAHYDTITGGAHKADLLRYCMIYVHGGLYADIKTVPTVPLDSVLKDRSKMYVVLSEIEPYTVYNGLFYSPPGSEIVKKLIETVLQTPNAQLKFDYLTNVRDMYTIINDFLVTKPLKPGLNKTVDGVPDIVALRETNVPEECERSDRRGYCTKIVDEHDRVLMIGRDITYPWH